MKGRGRVHRILGTVGAALLVIYFFFIWFALALANGEGDLAWPWQDMAMLVGMFVATVLGCLAAAVAGPRPRTATWLALSSVVLGAVFVGVAADTPLTALAIWLALTSPLSAAVVFGLRDVWSSNRPQPD
jgi:FtsH-binding integral membrane protein